MSFTSLGFELFCLTQSITIKRVLDTALGMRDNLKYFILTFTARTEILCDKSTNVIVPCDFNPILYYFI